MKNGIESSIYDIAWRVRLFQAAIDEDDVYENLSGREILILEIINKKQKMSISEVAEFFRNVSSGTISTTITKLWKTNKLVSKTIEPDNQRVTTVSLTKKGQKIIEMIKAKRAKSFGTLVQAIDLNEEEKVVVNRVLERGIVFFDNKFSLGR
jgi:DNA-binding MarR family transcriptional regulator